MLIRNAELEGKAPLDVRIDDERVSAIASALERRTNEPDGRGVSLEASRPRTYSESSLPIRKFWRISIIIQTSKPKVSSKSRTLESKVKNVFVVFIIDAPVTPRSYSR